MRWPYQAEAREESKDAPLNLIPGLEALLASPSNPISPFPLQALLTNVQFQGDTIGGLIGSRQEEDHVERLPTAQDQLIILELICVMLSAVLI